MIRIETKDAWLLITHRNHARLAGEFARHWKNQDFLPPDPFCHILDAVSRHDDSWDFPDTKPLLTPEGNPSAFSSELVGTYDAFEEIDLGNYLKVRGEATEAAAERDPYAAVLISMHTVNLLTEQADLSALTPEDTQRHKDFVEGQRNRQAALIERLSQTKAYEGVLSSEALLRGFRFLQACDSFSLYACVDYQKPGKLRHPQLRRDGTDVEISITPLSDRGFILDPYPLDEPDLCFSVDYRRVPKSATSDLASFQRAYAEAPPARRNIIVTAPKKPPSR